MTQNATSPYFGDTPTAEAWERCEESIEAFELAWREGELPNIDDFVHGESANRAPLLVELIHIDLEFRLKAGEAARAESYLGRYPHLSKDSAAVLDLLEAQHDLRQRNG